MNPFFIWLLKSSVSLALLYAVFKLAVSRDKMHTANRLVLLGILFTSVVLPFADVPVFRETQVIPQFEAIHEWVAAPVVNEPVFVAEDTPMTMSETAPVKAPLNPWLVFYLSVIGLLVGRLAFSVVRVWQIIRRAEKQHFRDVVLAIVKDFIQPFSFLQHIVLSEKDFTENKDIVVAHEYAHIQHKHALDLMICELFTALFWFNPVVWLLRRDLKLIHEYQADQAVLNQGIDAKTYQLLVLKKAVGERRFALANHFTQKPILKRIKMMHMKTNRRRTSLKLALFVPVVALLLQAFARPEMIVEKAGAYLPAIGQQDSSEVWVENWVSSQMKALNDESYLRTASNQKTPQLITIVDSDASADEANTFTKNNVFIVLQNSKGDLLVENQRLELKDLKPNLEWFLKGKNALSGEVPGFNPAELPFVGKVEISEGVILYRKDVETSQKASEAVMKSIAEAILNVRKETAQERFGAAYFSLPADKKKVINELIPDRVSLASPKKVRDSGSANVLPGTSDGEFAFVPPPFIVSMKSDGSFGVPFKNIYELRASLKKHRKWYLDYESKGKPKSTITFITEAGVSNGQINAVKDMLSKVQINNVRFTSQLDPVRISLKNNGDYIYHDERYDSPVEIKKQLIKQKDIVEKWNRQNGTQFDFNVNVLVESKVPRSDISRMGEALVEAGVKAKNIQYIVDDEKPGSKEDGAEGKSKYDVIVTNEKLQVFDRLSTVENLKKDVEEALKLTGDKTTISVLSFSDVPKEKLNNVLNELNQVPFVKVSTTVLKMEQEPVAVAQHKVLVKANGKIDLDNREYTLTEFETKLREMGNQPAKTNVALEVENEVTYLQIETVKRMLKEENIDQVGYSIQRHSVRETNPGTKTGEPMYAFSFGWKGGEPSLEGAKRAAEEFLSGTGNRSLYTSVSPGKNATQAEIDAVKKVLLEAGFLKVDVRRN